MRPRPWRFASVLAGAVSAMLTLASPQTAAATLPTDPSLKVVLRGAPKSYQVARIPVPARARGAATKFAVVIEPTVSLLSRASGSVAEGDTLISVVFGISSHARAGLQAAARVIFTHGTEADSVAVVMDVALVRGLRLAVTQPSYGARPGQRLRIGYRLTNLGNAADTARVGYDLPKNWPVQAGDSITIVDVGATVDRQLVTSVPRSANTGSFNIVVGLLRGDSLTNDDRALIEVVSPQATPMAAGLRLVTGLGVAGGSTGGRSAYLTYGLRGPVYGAIGIDVSFATAGLLDARARYRLSALGQLPQPLTMGVYGPGWRLQGGGVGVMFSDITGLSFGGRGTSLQFDKGRYRVDALFAQPDGAVSDSVKREPIAGVRLARQTGPVWLTSSYTRISDPLPDGRSLKALGGGIVVPQLFGGTLTTEVAAREWRGGTGVGTLLSYQTGRESTHGTQLTFSYAPGGTAAFAPALLNTSLAMNQQWSRLGLAGQGWMTSDRRVGESENSTAGIMLAPRLQLMRTVALNFDVGTRTQSMHAGATSLGLQEHRGGASFRWSANGTSFDFGGSGALVTRDVAIATDAYSRSFPRYSGQVQLSRGTVRFGSWNLNGNFVEDRTNTVALPREGSVALGLAQLPVYFYGGYVLRLNGLVQRMHWFGDRPDAWVMRGEAAIDLPFNLQIVWSADRRPFELISGAGRWATTLRITKGGGGIPIPNPFRPGARQGVVYQDLNANGIRDRGEPGLAGVIVRRDAELATTDDQGHYRFPAPQVGQHFSPFLQVDSRSLPSGWIEPSTPVNEAEAARVRDIGVVPTANVRVRLMVSREDQGLGGKLELSRALVFARDAQNRIWAATYEPAGTFLFGVLPPGEYHLEVDATDVGSVQLKDQTPAFRVSSNREPLNLTLEMATRKVRMFRKTTNPETKP